MLLKSHYALCSPKKMHNGFAKNAKKIFVRKTFFGEKIYESTQLCEISSETIFSSKNFCKKDSPEKKYVSKKNA